MDIQILSQYLPHLPHVLVIIFRELTKVLVVHECWPNASVVSSGGFRVGGARGKTKKAGPMMMSSCSPPLHFCAPLFCIHHQ